MSSFRDLPKGLVETVAKVLTAIKAGNKEEAPDYPELAKRARAMSGLPELGEDCGGDEHEDERVTNRPHAVKSAPTIGESDDELEDAKIKASKEKGNGPRDTDMYEGEEDIGKEAVAESYYASDEPSSAVGFRNTPEAVKTANVLEDVTIIGGERQNGYRLLVTYANQWTEIFPSTDLAPASTAEELLQLSSVLVDPNNECAKVLASYLNPPHLDPHFRGNDKD